MNGSSATSLKSNLTPGHARTDVSPSPQKSPLWLGVYFSDLALAIYPAGIKPKIIASESRGVPVVHAACVRARQVGIVPGMPIAAACALSQELVIYSRARRTELDRLNKLASELCRYSPRVALAKPDAVLLEIQGSLRLFGGLKSLCRQVSESLTAQGHCHVLAVTPTPLASLLLARNRRRITIVADQESLRSVLGELPVVVLDVEQKLVQRLTRIGVNTLCDLWRLPRDGLARRFGVELMNYLDRMIGQQPDPQLNHWRQRRFVADIELNAETADRTLLMHAIRHISKKLGAFLRHRAAAINGLQIKLHHLRRPATCLSVWTQESIQNPERFWYLFSERLDQTVLPAPVIKISVVSSELQEWVAETVDLFGLGDAVERDWMQTLEEIEARLGRDALRSLYLREDHRPEYAWSHTEALPVHSQPANHRPLWLLTNPRRLMQRQGQLWYAGPLRIVAGPERIESGWWDGQDRRRDYYHAISKNGHNLWIFHDLAHADRWYLHGLFG